MIMSAASPYQPRHGHIRLPSHSLPVSTPRWPQAGGALIIAESEFTGHLHEPHHLEVLAAAKKTIFSSNVIAGVLNISREQSSAPKSKYIVANNADDS